MERLPLEDVHRRLVELVDQVAKQHDRVTIVQEGEPTAVLLSVAEFESLMETMEILSDTEAMRDLRESAEEAEAGSEGMPVEQVYAEWQHRSQDVA